MQYLDNKENINIDLNEKKSILQKELNTKEILIGLGITGLVLAYGFLSVYPKFTEYKSAKTELQTINSNISDYESKINLMPKLQDELSDLKRELAVKSDILSHDMEDGMFLIGLSKLMDDVFVDLVNYSMDEIIPYESFYAIPTTITVRGDYKHVREIMYYLESQENMTQILDYNMKTYMEEQMVESVTSDTTTDDEQEEQQVEQIQESPKSEGVVEATFKFMMYSSENPTLELDNSDPNTWQPGKYNPFKTTSR